MASDDMGRPNIDCTKAVSMLESVYSRIVIDIKEFKSHCDRNFYVKTKALEANDEEEFVLKIVGIHDHVETERLQLINRLAFMDFIGRSGFTVPKVISTNTGELVWTEKVDSSAEYFVFLLTYLEGKTILDTYTDSTVPSNVLFDLGQILAEWRSAVQTFDGVQYFAPGWRLDNTDDFSERLDLLKDQDHVSLARQIIAAFQTDITPNIDKLDSGMTHGDFHDENIVILKKPLDGKLLWPQFAILDFMDTGVAPFLFDLATSVAFFMILPSNDTPKFLEAGGHFLAGYCKKYPLSIDEFECLYLCVCMAYVRELVVGESDYIMQGSENDYLLTSCQSGWTQLETIWTLGRINVMKKLYELLDKK